ncbi:terminase large subunit [Gordonia phage Morgana]|uniref:Terminase large subunit n=1 Tax=Gordonia phage Morgana TaxID=3137292 RepID=A0AAX4RAW1_9CAUD
MSYSDNDEIDDAIESEPFKGLSLKQMRTIVEAEKRVNVWEGAVRSGKTIGSILRWFMFLADVPPGGQLVMAGRTRDSLARNVLDPMQDPALFGSLASHVHYTMGAPMATILGRRVHIMGASDAKAEKALRGLTVSGAYLDEITVQLPEFFKQLLARMSVRGAKLFGTTNPDNPAHWFKVEYLDRIGDGPGDLDDWATWHFALDDNPSLPESYKRSLRREYTGLWYRRFVLGEWVAADGAVFDMWNPDVHVMAWDRLPRMTELISVGIDYGINNPTVAILVGLGEDNRLYAIDEWDYQAGDRETRATDAELSAGIKRWLGERHQPPHFDDMFAVEEYPDTVVLDPSASSLAVALQRLDVATYNADNEVTYGIRTLASLIARGRLVVSDRCRRLIREIPGYSWDPSAVEKGKDVPIKTADHAIDALRYALITTERRWRHVIDHTTIEPRAAA